MLYRLRNIKRLVLSLRYHTAYYMWIQFYYMCHYTVLLIYDIKSRSDLRIPGKVFKATAAGVLKLYYVTA